MINAIEKAAAAIAGADHLLIAAGAGMGVDSGLPDFRGSEGFWKAYPPFQKQGLSFYDLANPVWFETNPEQAWGFYGHRYQLYQSTQPHEGFQILQRFGQRIGGSLFVFTSNVDGHFQRSGFSENAIVECHGSFSHLQCHRPCSSQLWANDADRDQLQIDQETFLANTELPKCRVCDEVARPNILMFGDGQWVGGHVEHQTARFRAWTEKVRRDGRMVVLEIGAGTAVPTVRWRSEWFQQAGANLIRINPRESQGPPGTISIARGALQSLSQIEQRMG